MKKLYRAREGKMLAGVCAGLAEYFNVDPTLLRLTWVIFGMLAGFGLLGYLAAVIIMPEKPMDV